MGHLFSSLRVRLMALVLLSALPALGLVLYMGLEQRQQAASAACLAKLPTFQQVLETHDDVVGEYTFSPLSTLSLLPFGYPLRNASGIQDEHARPLLLHGMLVDISDIKRVEALLEDYAQVRRVMGPHLWSHCRSHDRRMF